MRKFNYLQLFALCYFLFAGVTTIAQVQLKVDLLPDLVTYQVLLQPQANYSGTLGLTNTGQVTVKVPTGGFSVSNLQSNIGNWGTPQVFVSPQEAPTSDYLVFSTSGSFTQEYMSGQELLLFSFENDGTCTGPLDVIFDTDPFVNNSLSASIGNSFTILGFGLGNAVSGVYDIGGANCGGNTPTCTIFISSVTKKPEQSCGGADGTIEITASGGNSTLEYSIDNGTTWSTNSVINQVAPGDYFIKVRETSNTSCEISYSGNPITILPYSVGIIVVSEEPSCDTNMDGSISIGTDSQDPTVQYSINNGETYFSNHEFTTIGNGTYNIKIKESNGCEFTPEDNPIVFNVNGNCDTPATDTDGDGIPDSEEDLNGDGNINNDDTDGDGDPNFNDPDDDGDNIMTSVEAGAPNGGDGNGDSIPDCLQNTVASQLSTTGAYHTLVSGANNPIIVYTIVGEENVTPPNLDELYNYPYNLDGFWINATGSINVSIIYHEVQDITNLVYRKYGPMTPGGQDFEWYDFPHALSMVDIGGTSVGRVQLTLTDNALGDSDEAVGRIVDPGGLAEAVSACDVTFSLSENNGIYEMNMESNVTYAGGMNTVANMQVTLRAPTGAIAIDKTCILDTYGTTDFLVSTIESPTETPAYDYISFSIDGNTSSDLTFTAGETTNLFTFKGLEGCTSGGVLELVGQEGIPTPTLAGSNVASQLSTLGGGIDQPICMDATSVPIVCENSTATPANTCDVTYILTETNGVYQVSMASNVTYAGTLNTVASMQVSLRAPAGVVTIDETCILDTYGSTEYVVSNINSPSETPTYDYFSFTVDGSTTSELTFTDGVTIPLFSFKNIGDCSATGVLELIGTGGIPSPTLASKNVASQLSTLGGGIDQPVCVDAATVPVTCPDGVTNICDVTYAVTETNGVYQVSMASNVTYIGALNTVASMQVSFRAPTGVVSIDETCILDTYGSTEYVVSTVTSPSETPAYDYFSFTVDGSTSSELTFTDGVTIPLFTFKNIGDCAASGVLELIGPGGVATPNLASKNVASQLSTLGGGIDQPICVDGATVPIVCPEGITNNCDVTYILSESNGVYEVQMESNVSYTGAQNTVASMQVSMRAPVGVIDIDNTCILDTYGNTLFIVSADYSPNETPDYDYFSFTVDGSTTNDLTFTAGETISLFTFKNIGDCSATGSIELIGTGGIPVPNIPSANIGSQLSTVGGGIDQPVCVDGTAVPVVCAPLNCDITYILEGPTAGLYTMKMLSDRTLNALERTISTMQITIRTPTGTLELNNDCIEENYAGTIFELASEIINPAETPGFDYYSFSLTSFGTNSIPFEAGDTVTLFTFKGLQDCTETGDIYLVGENGAFPVPTIPSYNLSSQLFVLGGGGEDSAVCVDDRASPVQCQNPCPDYIIDVNSSDLTDCGSNDGQIVINVTPSTGAIYSIDNGDTWHTNSFFSTLNEGTYTIVVASLDTTCTTSFGPVEILGKIAPAISNVMVAQPTTCDGTGSIEITSSPASGVIYSVDGGITWSTTNIFPDLAAGNFDIAIANGDTSCIITDTTQTLSGPSSPVITDEIIIEPAGCDGDNGFIQIVTEPSTGLIYSIDGGDNWSESNVFSNLGSITYSISVALVGESCVRNGSEGEFKSMTDATITDVDPSDPTTCSGSDGQIIITSSPSTNVIYSIDGGITWSTNPTFTDLDVNFYSIRIANPDTSCVVVGTTLSLSNPTDPLITNVEETDPSTCAGTDGRIVITSDPATGLIYSIDGGSKWSANNVFTGLGSGFYAIRIAQPDTTCAVSGSSFSLDNPQDPVITNVNSTDPTNCDNSNGAITITSFPTSGLIYSVDGGVTWSNSTVFSNLDAENYTIGVAYPDTSCMVFGSPITLEGLSSDLVSAINITDPTTASSNDGCIEVVLSCDGEFEYSNDGGASWQSSNLFCDLGNGEYAVRVRCMDLTCSEEPEPVVLSSNNVSCATITVPVPNMTLCNQSNSPITLSIDSPIDSYMIEGGSYTDDEIVGGNSLQFNAQLNGLINFFTINIRTTTGCDLVEEFVLYQAQNTEADFVVIEPYCRDGEVTIRFTGNATPNAALIWTLDGGTLIDSSAQTGSAPALSEITVQWTTEGSKLIALNVNDTGCIDDHVESIFVRKLPLVTTMEDQSICLGACTQLEGDGSGVWYTWSPAEGLSDPDIPNPMACPTTTTTYTLDVMGADGCVASTQVTITVNEFESSTSPDTIICIGESAPISATGGVSYAWSPANSLSNAAIPNPIATPPATTTYTVTITDERGCTNTEQVTVTVEPLPNIFILGDPELCEGESTQLEASVHAQYLWSPAEGLSSTTIRNPTASPTSTTTYRVTVTSEAGCTATSQFLVNVNPSPIATVGPDPTICNGQNIQISATGGGTYLWSPTNNLINSTTATPTVSPSSTTTYNVVVTAANGCTDQAAVTVNVESLDITATALGGSLCPGEMAQLSAGGGVSYVWSPTDGLNNPNIANPEARPGVPTEYCVTVTDAQGCTGTSCVMVDIDFTCVPPNCDITASGGGTICAGESTQLSASGSFNYTWSPTTGLSNATIANPQAAPTETTTYTVTGMSENGCMSSAQVTVTVGETPFIITYREKELCAGDSIYLLVNNHASYAWSPTNTMLYATSEAPLVFPTTSTVYTVTVTNAAGCTNTENINVTVTDCGSTPPITCQVNAGADITICQGQSMFLNGSNAVTYSWSPATGLSNPNISNPIAAPSFTTTYTVTGTDASGCVSTDQVTVFIGGNAPVAVACEDKTICEGESIQLVVNNHSSYLWAPSATLVDANTGTPTASPQSTTTYTVTVTNEDGCTDTDMVTIFVEDCTATPPSTNCANGPTANAGGDVSICEDGSIVLLATGGINYVWSPSSGLSNSNIANPVASPSSETTYTVTVTDANGCTATDQVIVFVVDCTATPPSTNCANGPIADAGPDFAMCPGGSSSLLARGGVSYLWSPTSGLSNPNIANPTVSVNSVTTYRVTVTDANGCSDIDEVQVMVSLPITTSISTGRAGCCGEGGGSINLNAAGGFGNLTYTWSDPSLSGSSVSNIESGMYSVTISDAQGCSIVESIMVGSNCGTCPSLFESEHICALPGADIAEVCLPISYEDIADYVIMVDGVRVAPVPGCEFENTVAYSFNLVPELFFSASFRVNRWTINGEVHSIDIMTVTDLTNWMNNLDREGFWILDNNALTLMGGVPTNTYGAIELIDLSDNSEVTLQPSITSMAVGTLVEVDVSDGKEHQVIVQNSSFCCTDEVIVSNCISGQPCLDDMIAADLLTLQTDECDGTATFCIEIPYAEIGNYTILQNGATYNLNTNTCSADNAGFGTQLTVGVGSHEFIFENGDNGCQDRLLIEVGCPELVVLETTIEVGDTLDFCLSTVVDGATIDSSLQTCLLGGNENIEINQTADNCWEYIGLGTGQEEFCVTVCTTDGVCKDIIQVVTIIPAEIPCEDVLEQTAYSASIPDCFGNAEFCVAIPFDSIRSYGMMMDGQPFREAILPCAEGISIEVGVGTHILRLTHLQSGCTEEISFKVVCALAATNIAETIQKGDTSMYCPDGLDLPGSIISIENICPESGGNAISFELDSQQNCIQYIGKEIGLGMACLVICDNNGVCDTINLTVFVIEDDPLLPIAVSDSMTTQVNIPITMRVMENDQINGNLRILETTTYPSKGIATMNDDNTITYIPEDEFCEMNAPQFFDYRICNEDGCDTARITVRIPCQEFEIKTGFSPNGDGVNDAFYIQGLQLFPDNELQVFNRWGNQVFNARGYKNNWEGTFEEQTLPGGTYFYVLKLGTEAEPLTGYVQIQR